MCKDQTKFFAWGVIFGMCVMVAGMYATNSGAGGTDVRVRHVGTRSGGGVASIIGLQRWNDTVLFSWTAPTTGTPAVMYTMQVDWTNGEDYAILGIEELYESIPLLQGDTVRVRVAGIDAANVQGPWSVWSQDYAVTGGQGLRGGSVENE